MTRQCEAQRHTAVGVACRSLWRMNPPHRHQRHLKGRVRAWTLLSPLRKSLFHRDSLTPCDQTAMKYEAGVRAYIEHTGAHACMYVHNSMPRQCALTTHCTLATNCSPILVRPVRGLVDPETVALAATVGFARGWVLRSACRVTPVEACFRADAAAERGIGRGYETEEHRKRADLQDCGVGLQ